LSWKRLGAMAAASPPATRFEPRGARFANAAIPSELVFVSQQTAVDNAVRLGRLEVTTLRGRRVGLQR
jgi:hypothetical protein